MSLMSPDEPMIRPLTQCPYCDHHSPEGSKFCNACGAALHLVPCPHCGAVNDVSKMDVCGSCHGDLRTARAPRMPKPAQTPADEEFLSIHLPLEDSTAAGESPLSPAPMYAQDQPIPVLQPGPHRLRRAWLVGGALALLAAAYYAWQIPEPSHAPARELEAPRAGPAPKSGAMAASTPPAAVVETATDAALKAAEAALQSAGAAAAAPSAARGGEAAPHKPVAAAASATALTRRGAAAARAAAASDPAPLRGRPIVDDPVLRPTRPAAPAGPCTEAVAALGLCASSDVRPRSP